VRRPIPFKRFCFIDVFSLRATNVLASARASLKKYISSLSSPLPKLHAKTLDFRSIATSSLDPLGREFLAY